MVKWLIDHYQVVARALAWVGMSTIIVLSVVPADDRPVFGTGLDWHLFEHFSAFALVAGAFSIGYRLSLIRAFLFAFCFCGGIELLQIPLQTRHARLTDFAIDFAASCIAIAIVLGAEKLIRPSP